MGKELSGRVALGWGLLLAVAWGGQPIASAQNTIVADDTLEAEQSEVITIEALDFILEGAVRGQNLFHSFEEFSIGEGGEAYFVTGSEAITNIFARVTGNNISDIQGILGTTLFDGVNFLPTEANLFLINPNGIVFGENAVLNVGGSFTATTASGVQFGDVGQFSTAEPDITPQSLNINPSAYFFNHLLIGEIQNQSIFGLQVPDGNRLTLIGGNINIESGILIADGGRIELAAVGSSIIGLDADGNLIFPNEFEQKNITISDRSFIVSTASEGGSIILTGHDINFLNNSVVGIGMDGEPGNHKGQAGDVVIQATGTVRLDNGSLITNRVLPGRTGDTGNVLITASTLEVNNGSQIEASTFGIGNAGNVVLTIAETARFNGADPINPNTSSFAGSEVGSGSIGNSGNLTVKATNLEVTNGAQLSTSTFGEGNAGNLILEIADTARFDGISPSLSGSASGARSQIEANGRGRGGNLRINAHTLEVTNGAQLSTSTLGQGDAGDVILNIADTVHLDGVNLVDGTSSGVGSTVERGVIGRGGNLRITTTNLEITNRATLSAQSQGIGDAGNIFLDIHNRLTSDNGSIVTSALLRAGGQIDITATRIFLEGDSDIQTFVSSGKGGGGDISITADFIIALNDSDILAFADDGAGGNITLQTPAFFGQNFTPTSLTADPATLEDNDRVDINATGAVAGLVSLPNVTFVENSLNDLTENIVVTDQLLAGSCIARTANNQGSFVITGNGGLPLRPGDSALSAYPTSEIQALPNTAAAVWQPGDPIVEPTGAYALSDGRLVLSRECN